MKKLALALVVVAAASSLALAGEVYGKILDGTASVGDGATVEAKCGAKAYPAVKTDKAGSYHLVLAETGKCTMTVKYKQQSASLEIASYEDAVQYDLALEMQDGKLTARRK
jgi:hypothetical protein